MVHLIDGLLRLARASRVELGCEQVNLAALVRHVAAECAQAEP